jgi:catechol 2,3-dioxygenase-like lactoylglutathione lyase family enzyme
LYAKDPEKSREYYRQFLGFEQAYQLDANRTEPAVWIFKINDRQFVEIYRETEPNSDRLRHIAIETPDAQGMRDYLGARGVTVPDRISTDRMGNAGFGFHDPEGHLIQVVQYAHYIELMLYKDAPAPTSRGSAHHLCLETHSVPESAADLGKRPYRSYYTRTIEIRVGRNRRRQVNLFDPDGTRAELMEPHTVDGVPPESSSAPPP